MVKAITPFSTRAKEGATDAPLGDFVVVDQTITSTANAGFYDKNTGKFEGVLGSDKLFTIDATHEAVPNSASVLSPQVTPQYIDMTGFNDVMIAIKTNQTGSYPIAGIMGPNDISFANLNPIDPASNLRGSVFGRDNLGDLLTSTVTLTADVWNIFTANGLFKGQKLLQFKITNSSGSEANIQFAYLRMV